MNKIVKWVKKWVKLDLCKRKKDTCWFSHVRNFILICKLDVSVFIYMTIFRF